MKWTWRVPLYKVSIRFSNNMCDGRWIFVLSMAQKLRLLHILPYISATNNLSDDLVTERLRYSELVCVSVH